MHAAFVLPDPDDTGPGADYVRHLVPALRDAGVAASVLAVSDAALRSLHSGGRVAVELPARPELYR